MLSHPRNCRELVPKGGCPPEDERKLRRLPQDTDACTRLMEEKGNRFAEMQILLRDVNIESLTKSILGPAYRRVQLGETADGFIQFNPPTDAVDIYEVDNQGQHINAEPVRPVCSGTGAVLRLDELPSPRTVLPGRHTLTIHVCARGTRPQILLHEQTISYSVEQVVHSPSEASGIPGLCVGIHDDRIRVENCDKIIAHGSRRFILEFRASGRPLSSAQITGNIFRTSFGEVSALCGVHTNVNGQAEVCLRAGRITDLQAVSEDATVIVRKKDALIVVEQNETDSSSCSKETRIVVDATQDHVDFRAMFDLEPQSSMLFLGDCSGSMSEGDRIEKMKASLIDLLPDALAQCNEVWIGVWNTSYKLFPSCINEGNLQNAVEWISNAYCCGGTKIKQAIQGAIAHVGNVTDVYILTDGLLADWQKLPAQKQVESWAKLRATFPDTAFHFAAIGEASATMLQTMAAIGGGNYYENYVDLDCICV